MKDPKFIDMKESMEDEAKDVDVEAEKLKKVLFLRRGASGPRRPRATAPLQVESKAATREGSSWKAPSNSISIHHSSMKAKFSTHMNHSKLKVFTR